MIGCVGSVGRRLEWFPDDVPSCSYNIMISVIVSVMVSIWSVSTLEQCVQCVVVSPERIRGHTLYTHQC